MSRTRGVLLLGFVFLPLAFPDVNEGLYAQEWEVFSVDPAGKDPNLAIGPDNVPQIVYFISAPNSVTLKHGTWDENNQQFQLETAAVGAFRTQAGIAIDLLNRPHVSCHDHSLGNPVHVWKNGTTWIVEEIDSPNHDGWSSSIALGSDNLARVSFNDGGDPSGQGGEGVEYAWYDGAGWHVEPIGSDTALFFFNGTSLALTQSDSAYIAYYDDIRGDLMLGTGTSGGNWSISQVDTDGDVGRFPSLRLDHNDHPRIGYYRALSSSSGIVRLATFTGTDWQFVNIDTLFSVDLGEDVENMISIAIDAFDRTQISYADEAEVKYAIYDGVQVIKEVIAGGEGSPFIQRTAIALDSDGNPKVTYGLPVTRGGLFYARKVLTGFSPVVSDIPDQTALRLQGWKLGLDGYVRDPDNDDDEISWTITGNDNLIVTYHPSTRVALISLPSGWKGSDTLTFTATDPDGLSDSDDAIFRVGPPVVSDIPDQIVQPGDQFARIRLNSYVQSLFYPDADMRWSFEGMTSMSVRYDSVSQKARIIAPAGWTGSETIMFTAQDPEGFTASDAATFTVLPSAATTVMIPASRDNTLYEDEAGVLSNGVGEHLFVGKNAMGDIRRALVRFSVSDSIPAGATILTATVTLNMSRSVLAGDEDVQVRRVLTDWGEGSSNASGQEGAGAASTVGDATWLHTFYAGSFWGSPGGDFSDTVSAVKTIGGIGSYSWDSTPELAADVQDWVTSPAGNFGWVLLGDELAPATSKRFDSRENLNAANRPMLTVSYSVPHGKTVASDGPGDNTVPGHVVLSQNYPNPFNPSTTIRFGLPEKSHVRLEVFNLLGERVALLVDAEREEGYHDIVFDARTIASGLYLYRLMSGNSVETRKFIVLK